MTMLWFGLAVACWVLFFALEGFDFGVGALAPVLGRDDHERGAALATIGPVWDGNEVWLVAAVGVTFAAFPDWYAALLSGLYLPLVAVLLALAARGVALEFRGKGGTLSWRRWCDAVLAGSSLLVAALWGAILGVGVDGLALRPDGEVVGGGLARSLAPLVAGPALLGAVLGVAVAILSGATFLGLRTTGPVRRRARLAALAALPVIAVAVLSTGVPAVVVPVVGVLAVVAALVRWRREALAFALATLGVAVAVVSVFVVHLPVVLPSTLGPSASLTVASTAASHGALVTLTWAGALVLPAVVVYQGFSYWVFRRRVASGREVAT